MTGQPLIAAALILLLGTATQAQTVVAKHLIRARTIIRTSDIRLNAKSTNGALSQSAEVIGLEARVILYPGRPIRAQDVGPAAVIKRNQIVTVIYRKGALAISVDGRALDRGGIGDRIQVMNLSSRASVFGIVQSSSQVKVQQ